MISSTTIPKRSFPARRNRFLCWWCLFKCADDVMPDCYWKGREDRHPFRLLSPPEWSSPGRYHWTERDYTFMAVTCGGDYVSHRGDTLYRASRNRRTLIAFPPLLWFHEPLWWSPHASKQYYYTTMPSFFVLGRIDYGSDGGGPAEG